MDQITLSKEEGRRLEQLEGVIERGLKTFVDVGQALVEIRESKLYREWYGTFEAYCEDRWAIKQSRVYQLMDAAQVVDHLKSSTIVELPANESQARPLSKLPPEQQPEAWQRAVETAPNGKVTGVHVAKVVDEYLEPMGSADGDGGAPGPVEDSFDKYTPPTGRNMDVHYSSEKGEWETPQPFFDLLDREFGFTLDVCALPENAKCRQFFTPDDDGLVQEWKGVCWMNPPYGDDIKHWVQKAYRSALAGATVVCLVPARTDTRWWWNYCIKGEIRFLKGRLKFGGGENSAPFPSAVVIFRPGGGYRRVIWWKEGSGV